MHQAPEEKSALTTGRETADAVIVGVAQRLEECMRATDVLGRIGGDTFGIVLGNADELGIAAAAERKRLAAEKENEETSPSATS